MSVEAETKPASHNWPAALPPETGWSWKKICFLIVLAFTAVVSLALAPVRIRAQAPQPKAMGRNHEAGFRRREYF